MKIPIIGKYNLVEAPDYSDELIQFSEIKENWSFLTISQLIKSNQENSEIFSLDNKLKLRKNSFFYYSYETNQKIFEIESGLTPFRITFSLTAKCGFEVKGNSPQYPDTLYEGTIIKDFNLENNNGKISIVENRKDVK